MKITKVAVRYGELRSAGYPSFSNKRVEIELQADLESTDVPNNVKDHLFDRARASVRKALGDQINDQGELFQHLRNEKTA